MSALRCSIFAAYPDLQSLPPDFADPKLTAPVRAVFDRLRKVKFGAVETAYRTAAAAGAQLPPWEERPPGLEIELAVFVAVADALIKIADEQLAAFEAAKQGKAGEDRRARMRQRVAGRRAKRQARKARRPEAVKKYLANQARNRKASPPPKAKTSTAKTKAKTPAPKKGGKR